MSDEKRSEDGHDEPAEATKTSEGSEASASADAPTAAETVEAKPAEDAAVEEPSDEEEDEDATEDAANPAAIARRVAALGADDRDEAFAREEERKLAERRAAGKKKGTGKKKVGLEAAASKKLGKIGTRAEPKRSVAVAADADPLIAQTTKISDWAKKNQKTVQAVGLVVVAGLLGAAGFLYWDHKRESEASQGLAKAVETQSAKIGEAPKSEEDDHETYYKTFADRQNAALAQYKDIGSKFPHTGAAILARLAEGSLLLDKRDADGALAAFNDVKGSALAAADTEVKGRALEGVGFAYELKALATPAEKDKDLDAALAAFKELENAADVKGFKELAMYHQARVLQNKGEKDKAKEILLSLKERLNKSEDPIGPGIPPPPTFPYLKEVAMDRLHEIDPDSAPKAPKGGGAGMPGMPGGAGGKMSQEQMQKLIEQMKKQGGGKPGGH